MAIDIQTITCPQCGSKNINMINETQGECESCGTQITVQQRIETQNVYYEVSINSDNKLGENRTFTKSEIIPEYTKDEFIRKAWIALAKEDAPIEVFKENFDDVTEICHEVLVDSVEVNVDYQVSVGYDREEPYIDYEDYWEDEPYITTESYYDRDTQSQRTRQVTKYKKVKKQRQVTKYKTVTDWSALNGTHETHAVAVVENTDEQVLDEERFFSDYMHANKKSIVPVSENQAKKMEISIEARVNAEVGQESQIYESVIRSLPGDHNRDLDYISKVKSASSELFKAKEYETSISFKGKKYTKQAFPFGKMNLVGDEIENEISLDSVIEEMRTRQEDRDYRRRAQVDKNVAKATSWLSILTIVLLVASSVVSLLVRSIPLVLILFGVSVVSFVANTLMVNLKYASEKGRAESDIYFENEKMEKEIENYSDNYKIKQQEALNQKLRALGYKPASAEEL